MKHTLRTIIWVIAMTLGVCASAQTDTKRAFRMYMHDGSVQFFFYSDIQSMTVGYEDGDMERPVQIINTPDSVYTFAMADIDSVSFARPVTEYKSNVVRLEDGLRSYLTASDSLKLTFRSDVPRNLFPTEGGYLVTLECDDLLPGGFIGKLASVREEGEGVVALCDKAAATDVFEKLFIAIGENTTETSNKANTMRAPEDSRVWNGDIDIPPVGRDVKFDIGLGTSALTGVYSQSAGFEINTQKFHARTFFMVENGELDFSMLCQGEHTLNLDASVGFADSFSKEFPPIVKIPIRVPYAFLPIGSCDFGIYFDAEAGIGINHHFKVPFRSVTHFAFGTRWYPIIGFVPVINNVPNRCHITMGVPEIELDLEGSASVELGVYGSANIYPAVEEISKLSTGSRTGLRISSQVSWLPTVGPIDKVNTEMYDELNRDDFFRLDWLNTGFVSLKSELFNVNLNEKIQWNATRNNPIWKRGVVPEFFDVSLSKSDVAGSLTATATLRRKLAFNTNVGLGLYDSSDRLVDSWWCDVKYKDQENTQIAHDFSNLKAGEKYTLHPLVHALNDNMVANPSDGVSIVNIIETGNASLIDYEEATLSAQINLEGINGEYVVGFCCIGKNGEKRQIFSQGDGTKDISIEITDLEKDTEYSYYAFVQLDGVIGYGETKTFKTLCDNPGFELRAKSYYSASYAGDAYITGRYDLHYPENNGSTTYILDYDSDYFTVRYLDIEEYARFNWSLLRVSYTWHSNREGLIVDYANYKCTSSVGVPTYVIFKYALSEEPNNWHYTKLPITLDYEDTPYYSVRPFAGLRNEGEEYAGAVINVKGAFWFSSISFNIELYGTIQLYDEDGNIEEVPGDLLDDKLVNLKDISDWFDDYMAFFNTTSRFVNIRNVKALLRNGVIL